MLVATVLVSAFVVLMTILIVRFRKHKAHFDKMPGPDDFRWTTGNVHLFNGEFNEKGIKYHLDLLEKHPYFYRFWFGPAAPAIFCVHPDLFKIILKSSAPKARGNALVRSPYEAGMPWIGEGLLMANGHKWRRNRKLLTPAFHFDVLKSYMSIFNKAGDTFLSQIEKVAKDGKSVDVQSLFSLQSLDIIMQCALSYDINCQESGSEYIKAVQNLTALWMDRCGHPVLMNDLIYSFTPQCKEFKRLCKFVHDLADEVITKRKKELESKPLGSVKVKDFLDTLLTARDEEGIGMDNKEIRDEVDTFMFEGHDTTAMALTFFMYCMAISPEYQEKCYEEICQVMGDRENIEWSDLNRLEYLGMCIKESLRLNPSIPFTGRTLEEDVKYKEYTFPKGTQVLLAIYLLHRNPALWKDPAKFQPERFLPSNMKDMDPFQFLPFSAGARNCIGQNFAMYEMKVLLPKILKKYKVTLDDSVPVKRFIAIAITTEDGINLHFTPRDQ